MWGFDADQHQRDTQLSAAWVRCRYFVQDGYIRPVRGAHVEAYDPFEAYYANDSALLGRSLYLQLVDLDTTNEQEIEKFVSRWGLLGLFQHNLIQARHVECDEWEELGNPDPPYAVTVSEIYEWPGASPGENHSHRTIAHGVTAEQYQGDGWLPPLEPDEELKRVITERGWGHFTEEGLQLMPGAMYRLDDWLEERELRRYKQWRSRQRYLHGSALIELPERGIEEVSLPGYYSRFFPDSGLLRDGREAVIPTSDLGDLKQMTDDQLLKSAKELSSEMYSLFPRLYSKSLWYGLCEPLKDFRQAVSEFRATYVLATQVRLNASVAPGAKDWEEMGRSRDLRRQFTRHLRRVHPFPHCDRETQAWSLRWSFPSLLAAGYGMMFLDFTLQKRKLRFCQSSTCGKSFVSERSDRQYCSTRCQNAQKQRERREREKQETQCSSKEAQIEG